MKTPKRTITYTTKDGKKSTARISESLLKLVEHNKYLERITNEPYKNPVVQVKIRGIRTIQQLLKKGMTVAQITDLIKEENKGLELPKSLESTRRKINREKGKQGKRERVKRGGVLWQYRYNGKSAAASMLKNDLKRVQGYSVPGNVQALIDALYSAVDAYETLGKDLTQTERGNLRAVIAAIRRNKNTFPDKIVEPIYQIIYRLKNAEEDAVTLLAEIELLMTINGVE